ncbi:MAG TPA: DUF5069 domain-containing protein [Candidatus Nanoarchaeia archaeon]|nr:DUF5069 domain-containing protein [Candidatus Nanoarchaeia archaeon]
MNKEKLQELAIDLEQEYPCSPKQRVKGMAHLPRMLDKCRATLLGNNGEYHYDCPTDKRLFTFFGIDANKLKDFVATGATNEEVFDWILKESGKNQKDVERFTADIVGLFPADNPQMAAWFNGECKRLGLDPQITTLFDYLEFDDGVSFE